MKKYFVLAIVGLALIFLYFCIGDGVSGNYSNDGVVVNQQEEQQINAERIDTLKSAK